MDDKTTEWRPGPSMNTVCRCCLSDGCYKDISTEYFWMGKREVYAEMLSETLDVTIAYSQSGGPNSNSRLICETCISRLRDACEFKKQVLECEKTFMQHLDPGRIIDSVVEVTLDNEVKIEKVKQERKLSDDDEAGFDDAAGFGDDDYDDLDDQPLTALASKVPKKESTDMLDLRDNNKAAEKRKATIKLKTTTAKKAKTKTKDTLKASASKSTKTPIKAEKKKKGSLEVKLVWKANPRRKYNDERDNAAIIIEFSNVCPFRWRRGAFVCGFCAFSSAEFNLIKNHSLEHPNKVEAMRCSRRFDSIKIDISNLHCEICLEPMKNIDLLKDHLLNIHNKQINNDHGTGVIPFLLRDNVFTCPMCNDTFELFSKLNTHMNKHYPNNICFECGKSFSAKTRFKAHLLIHKSSNNGEYKCGKCDKVFATRVLKYNHLSVVHGPQYKYRCPYCNESFKLYADRARHLKNMHGQKIEYACHLCPAVFLICNQRTKHIKQVHIKDEQFFCALCPYKFVTAAQLRSHMIKHGGERKYQCQVCKKAYARTKTLREHMRIHNNDKRFVCEYCNNAFVQKCSLRSHIRTHHSNVEPLKKLRPLNTVKEC